MTQAIQKDLNSLFTSALSSLLEQTRQAPTRHFESHVQQRNFDQSCQQRRELAQQLHTVFRDNKLTADELETITRILDGAIKRVAA